MRYLIYGSFILYVFCRSGLFLLLPTQHYLETNDGHPLFNTEAIKHEEIYRLGAQMDAVQYLKVSRLSLFNPDFYFARPFVYPLLIKILHQNYNLIFISQLIISIVSWIFLSYCVMSQLYKPIIKISASLLILLFSLSGYIIFWDGKLYTESITISLLVLFIGTFLLAFRYYFKIVHVFFIILLSFLLINIRDANLLFIFFISIAMLVASIILYNKKVISIKQSLILFISLSLISAFGNWTANRGERYNACFEHLLNGRFYYNNELIRYFSKRGMPDSIIKTLVEMKEKEKNYLPVTNNLIEARWIRENAKKIYSNFLISHPAYLLESYTKKSFWTVLISAPLIPVYYFSYDLFSRADTTSTSLTSDLKNLKHITVLDIINVLSEKIGKNVNSWTCFSAILLSLLGLLNDIIVLIIACISLIYFYKQPTIHTNIRMFILSVYLFLFTSTIGLLFIFHADAMEVMRHQLLNRIQLSLSVYIMSFIIIDNWFSLNEPNPSKLEIQ